MKTEELVIPNRDGKRMNATLLFPVSDPLGTAIIFHGLAAWKDQRMLVAVAELLVARGYIVLRFNESNGILSPDGDFFTSTTTGYTHDVEDVIAYVHQARWHEGPLTLVGHSLGALVAARYAAEHPMEVARLVLIAPAISWKVMWWRWLPLSLLWYIRGYRMILGIDGKKFALSPLWWMDFAKFDLMKYAPKIPVPVLIISAEQDHTVGRPTAQRALARTFPQGEHSMVSWTNHIFHEHEDEVVDTINTWLTSS